MMKKLFCLLTLVSVLFAGSMIAFADGTTTLTLEVPAPAVASYTLEIPENQSIEYLKVANGFGTVSVTESENFADNEYVSVKLDYSGVFASETTDTTLPASVQFTAKASDGTATADIGLYADDTILFMNNGAGGVEETGTIIVDSEAMALKELVIWVSEPTWEENPLDPGTYTMGITFTSEIVAK